MIVVVISINQSIMSDYKQHKHIMDQEKLINKRGNIRDVKRKTNKEKY